MSARHNVLYVCSTVHNVTSVASEVGAYTNNIDRSPSCNLLTYIQACTVQWHV